MKSSKRGVPRKRISFSISGVVSLVILLFYLLGAESATGAVKKQVTPNGKRLIDSPYFISKWDKPQPKKVSHGPNYVTGCHPHYHPECPVECEVVDIDWDDYDADWWCDRHARVWWDDPCVY